MRTTVSALDIEEAHRADRIRTSATKAPIVLARAVVERHIRELRARGLVTAPPNSAGLVLALESLSHDVASAILDARLATTSAPGDQPGAASPGS